MAQDANGLLFLLGEDFDESLLIQSLLLTGGIRSPILALRDFESARTQLLQLAHSVEWGRATFPHVAMVSLKQETAALEFLHWLRARPEFGEVIVLVLAGGARPTVLQAAEDAGANIFPFRSDDYEKLAEAIRDRRFCSAPELAHAYDSPVTAGG